MILWSKSRERKRIENRMLKVSAPCIIVVLTAAYEFNIFLVCGVVTAERQGMGLGFGGKVFN